MHADEIELSDPDQDVGIGWYVTDPDGNVVNSGPVAHAQAAAWVGELIAEAARHGEEQ